MTSHTGKIDPKKADKTQCKGEEKSNEKNEGKDEVQKVKKRRRSALCFLQQWAWSCSSMRRSARVRSSNRREAERDDVQLEETLRRIFPSTLLYVYYFFFLCLYTFCIKYRFSLYYYFYALGQTR